MAKKRKKKRNGKKKIILFVFEILLLLVVLGVLAIYNSTLGRINYKDKLTDSQAGIMMICMKRQKRQCMVI